MTLFLLRRKLDGFSSQLPKTVKQDPAAVGKIPDAVRDSSSSGAAPGRGWKSVKGCGHDDERGAGIDVVGQGG